MAFREFTFSSGITIRLNEVEPDGTGLPGVQVDVFGAGKDITAIMFDLANDSDLGSYQITPPDPNDLIEDFEYEVSGAPVFAKNNVDSVGGVNLNPAKGFDVGLAIADVGTSFVGATSFVLRGPGISLADFSEIRFGVRLSGIAGSSKIVETLGDLTPPATPTITNIIDDVAPITGMVANGGVTNDSVLVINGTAEANSTVTVFNGTNLLDTVTASSSGNWTFTTATLNDSTTYNFNATATDAAGNQSSPSANFTVTIDTTPPPAPSISAVTDNVAPITGTVIDGGITNDPALLVSGTAEANSKVTLFADSTALTTVTADANGTWNFTTGALTDATYNFSAQATDAAGNQSAVSADYTVTVDTTPPDAPTITTVLDNVEPNTGDVANGGTTNDTELKLQGLAEANSAVTIFADGIELATVTADGSGNWSFTTNTLLEDVTYVFSAIAADAAGNVSNASDNYTVTVLPPLEPLIVSTAFVEELDLIENLDFDVNGDGHVDSIVQPILGEDFQQAIFVTNPNSVAVTNTKVAIDATSNLFETDLTTLVVKDSNGNSVPFTFVSDNGETAEIEIGSIAAEETVTIEYTTVVPQNTAITTKSLTFTTEGSGILNDPPGDSFYDLTLYLNENNYSSPGNDDFIFGSFDEDLLTPALDAYKPTATLVDDAVQAQASLLATTLYGSEFNEFPDAQGDDVHTLFSVDAHRFNQDPLYKTSGTRESVLTEFELLLVWQGFDDPNKDTYTLEEALALLADGTFGFANADDEIIKDGQTFTGTLTVTDPNTGDIVYEQPAIAGNIQDEFDLVEPAPVYDGTGSFQALVNSLNPNLHYRIIVTAPGPIPALDWTLYSGDFVKEVVFENSTGEARIINFQANDELNLEGVRFFYDTDLTAEITPVPLSKLIIQGDPNNVGGDTVVGHSGSDEIIGSNGTDNFNGGGGDDMLSGGNGSDILNGGLGDDVLSGGSGKDTLVFTGPFGKDVILGYGDNPADEIVIEGLGISNSDFLDSVTTDSANNTTFIDLRAFGGGTITLEDYTGSLSFSLV